MTNNIENIQKKYRRKFRLSVLQFFLYPIILGFVIGVPLRIITSDDYIGNVNIIITAAIFLLSISIGPFITYKIFKSQKELELAIVKANDANKTKSEFLANMSHEIRTPLNSILGFADILLNMEKDPKKKEYLKIIKRSGQNLISIINDILDLAKIDAGKMSILEKEMNLDTVIDEVALFFKLMAMQKGLKLKIENKSDINNVIGDPRRLKQVLINLVGNAIKFTEKGVVKIVVEKLEQEKESVQIKFSVIDTGVGIAYNKVGLLFEAFNQLDNSYSREHGGTGLGLDISKRLVELMGGRIYVDTEEGKGSNFYFIVPFHLVFAESKTVEEKEDVNSDGNEEDKKKRRINYRVSSSNFRILAAEDDIIGQKLLSIRLEKAGCVFDIVGTGKKVLEKLEERDYDLIFMDVEMPEMDGITATKEIRATGNHVPIIALTANAMKGDYNRCIECGMDDYLSKPIDFDKFYGIISRYINLKDSSSSK